jgi:hypothetical protein
MIRGVIPGMLDPYENTSSLVLSNHTIMKSETAEVIAVQVGTTLSNIFFSLNEWTLPVGSVSMSLGGTI